MAIRLAVITPPAPDLPITVDEAKDHLRVRGEEEDGHIGRLVIAAREWCESFTGLALATQTLRLNLDRLPSEIELPRPPLQSVTSIKFLDENGTQQTVNTSVYNVDTVARPGAITLAWDQSWPTYRAIRNTIEIIYVAGYPGTASVAGYLGQKECPGSIKAAMLLLIGHLYENRENTIEGNLEKIPFGVESLLWQHKIKLINHYQGVTT